MNGPKLSDKDVIAVLSLINKEIAVNGDAARWHQVKQVIMEQNL